MCGSRVSRAQETSASLDGSGINDQDPADLPKDITELLHAWAGGDAGALEELLPLVYADLRRRAGATCAGNGGITRWSRRRSCTRRT